MVDARRVIVGIPARDEETHIGACLAALSRQTRPADEVIILLNNCTDRSLQAVRSALPDLPSLRVVERHLAPSEASAGAARRLVLDMAAASPGAMVVLTTDADAVPPDDWIEANLEILTRGAEVVCGMASILPADAARLPARMHEDHARERACLEVLDELDARIDPDPADPWPRHQQNSGASIAFTVAAYRRAGGAPHIAVGEDRALVAKFRLVDAKIRHAFGICVPVSGRLEGRAEGGMAAALARRIKAADEWADDALEPAIDAYRRALAKVQLRRLRAGDRGVQTLGHDLLIGTPAMQAALREPYFGVAWAQVQRLSPVLQRRRLRVAELPRETRQAAWLRDRLEGGADVAAPLTGIHFAR